MIMGVSGPQVTSGAQKNNNASDHGNTNRLMTVVKSLTPGWPDQIGSEESSATRLGHLENSGTLGAAV